MSLIFPSRYCGPPGRGNGGWVAGSLAARLLEASPTPAGTPSDVSVRLSAAAPLEAPLDVRLQKGAAGEVAELSEGQTLIARAEAVPALDLELPAPVTLAQARAAAATVDLAGHPFPQCFVCGPDRPVGDGLRIFSAPVDGRPEVLAATVTLPEASLPMAWAALDCPGGFAVGFGEDTLLLGTMTAHVERVPDPGREVVVVGWEIGREGRKRHCGSALFDDGAPIAWTRSTWLTITREHIAGTAPAVERATGRGGPALQPSTHPGHPTSGSEAGA